MTNLNDTIVACATPAGYASIAVIRISGNNSLEIARKILQFDSNIDRLEHRRAYLAKVIDPINQATIDRVMVSVFHAPQSFTGENLLEISCHGNPQIVEKIISLLGGAGARTAERGEFTRRALLNGKVDLIQAEALVDTVYAPCDEARRLAMMSYEGKFSEIIHGFRSKLIDLLVLIEATIDFPEEDDTQSIDPAQFGSLQNVINEIDGLINNAKVGIKIKEGYSVVIAGRANVGKSTLFNHLLGYDRSIVHEQSGTTRDYIEDVTEIAGLALRFYDTAGILGQRSGPDQIAEQRSLDLLKTADLILLLFDGSEAMNEQDVNLFNRTRNLNTILVINKIDMNLALETAGMLSDAIKVSALTGKNIDLLIHKIRANLLPANFGGGVMVTRQRHLDVLTTVRQCLEDAVQAANPETKAFELHAALDQLDELSGKVLRKEILDRIFEEFCIGK